MVLIAGLHIIQTCWKLLSGNLKTNLLIINSDGVKYSEYLNKDAENFISCDKIKSISFVNKYTSPDGSGYRITWGVILLELKQKLPNSKKNITRFDHVEYLAIHVVPKKLFKGLYKASKKLGLKNIDIKAEKHIHSD